MLRLSISSNKHGNVFKDFETQLELDNYVQEITESEHWGKNDRWVNADQEDVSNAIETREVEISPATSEVVDPESGEILTEAIPAKTITEYRLAAEYTIQQEDITAQVLTESLINDGKSRQELGALVIAKVYSINESKNISAQQFAAMIADANLERIERMLWTGSLRTAKMMIQALDNTYFTPDEKSTILSMLENY